MSSVVPDHVGYVTAARAWRVGGRPGSARLLSLWRPVAWPHERLSASCLRYGRAVGTWLSHHSAPAGSCNCGIWGLADPERLVEQVVERVPNDGGVTVCGTVALWGRVVVGAYGWRAEHAYPLGLVVPEDDVSEMVETLAQAYGIRVLHDWPELSSVEAPAS